MGDKENKNMQLFNSCLSNKKVQNNVAHVNPHKGIVDLR